MRFQKYNLYCILFKLFKTRSQSTVDSKPKLQNYKSHIKKKVRSCRIVNHFIDVCSDTDDPSRNVRFIIIDQLSNTNSLSSDKIDDLLLQKKYFGCQRLSLYIKDLITHMIGIENVVKNALNKDRPYDN